MLSNISVIFGYFENSVSPNSEIIYYIENNSNFVSPNEILWAKTFGLILFKMLRGMAYA